MQCFEVRGCKRHEFTSPQKTENKLGLTGICKKCRKGGKGKYRNMAREKKLAN